MKVGIDTFSCDHGRSGIGSYLLSLVKNLPDNGYSYELFGSELDRYTYDAGTGKTSYMGVPVSDSVVAERMWHIFRLHKFAKKQKYDAILYPAGGRLLPSSYKVPGIAVINDVVSELYRGSDAGWFDFYVKKSLRHATRIIAASSFIRKDLLKLKIDPAKIEVIHNGIDHSLFYPREQIPGDTVLIKPFSIKRPYIIYASRIHFPVKRHIELIKAFALFKKKTGLPHRLVLAGSDGVHAEFVHQEVMNSPVSSDIFLTGYFPHENLPGLYSCSDACIFPAVSEGVGLPVIEAMATGIPVACAKAGALPEIAANNALFFNADDPEEIASAIERIVTDTALRTKMIESGLKWTKRFSWEKTAAETIAILTAAASK